MHVAYLKLVFDENLEALSGLERRMLGGVPVTFEELRDCCWSSADKLLTFAGLPELPELYQQHTLNKEMMRSPFIRQAYEKTRGYAGDKDLMEMIYDGNAPCPDPFSSLLNKVFIELPAAEAVRDRMKSVAKLLDDLEPGSQVLSLACGSAREFKHSKANITVDLADHDADALHHSARNAGSRVRSLLQLNAFEFIKGKRSFKDISGDSKEADISSRSYDLIYSCGLMDYVPSFPDNPKRGTAALVHGLFELLKPGGSLVIGNFNTPGGPNKHQTSHRLMMELYSEWFLIYRSAWDMIAMTRTLPAGKFDMQLFNEMLETPDGSEVIHLMRIRRLG